MNNKPIFESGSFRDPSGSIFYYKDRVFRQVDEHTFQIFKHLENTRIIATLQERQDIISSRTLSAEDQIYHELKKFFPQTDNFIEHQKIPFISYPYEWSFSMLAEAAILYLRLQIFLIENGYSLKDATAFNIQFVNSKPIFIDIPSIEFPLRKDIWVAYGQFCQMFLFPLLLYRFKKIDLKNCFLSNINGVTVDYIYKIFGFFSCLRPCLFLDVFLQYMLGKVAERNIDALKKDLKEKQQGAPDAQLLNLKRLLRKIKKLSDSYKGSTPWLDYASTNSYPDAAESEKKEYVRHFFTTHSVQSVLDLGCNTGQYSLIAADAGANVIAIDSDHDCIDYLYRHIKKNKKTVLPLCIDIANPSPAIGFCNRERKTFISRAKSDCVFALALVHHLLVSSRIPLPEIRDFLYDLTNSFLLIEFIPPEDAMFQRLLALRENIYAHFDISYFLSIFSEKFESLNKKEIPHTKRILFIFRKKNES